MKAYVKIQLRPYKTKELAPYYKRSTRQFQRELALVNGKYGKKSGHHWEIPQVLRIFDDYGWPEIEIEISDSLEKVA